MKSCCIQLSVLTLAFAAMTVATVRASAEPPEIPPAAAEPQRKLAPRLRSLVKTYESARATGGVSAARVEARRFSSRTLSVDAAARVQVYVHVGDLGKDTLAVLRHHGLDIERASPELRLIQGWIPVDRLDALAAEPSVLRIRAPGYGEARAGAVVSAGVAVHRCSDVAATGLTGAGVRVGVISNGVDGLEGSQAAGELPAVQVLERGVHDEGTALLEIVHDCAPRASLLFAAGGSTSLAFVEAVERLRNAGAHVILDDLVFTDEAFFEDGMIGGHDRAVGDSVVRISAAGNDAQSHYQGLYVQGTFEMDEEVVFPGDRHNFGGGDELLRIRVPGQSLATLILQWANPFGASADDYDLCVRRPPPDGRIVDCSFDPQEGPGDDPYEAVDVFCETDEACFFDVQIMKFAGEPRLLKLLCFNGGCSFQEFNVPDGSIYGHPGVPEVLAVGAVPAHQPSEIEPYSSRGPATVLFPSPGTRSKPDVTAIDRVATSRPEFESFAGTSAAAAHTAAVAALALEADPALSPPAVRARLMERAIDLGPPGFDLTFGAGRVDAVLASSVRSRLGLVLNQSAFGRDQTMVLSASVVPGDTPGLVDVYLVIQLPDGSLHSLTADGQVVPRVVPVASGFAPFLIPAVEVVRHTFAGGEPPGTYTWFGALTHHGTQDLVGGLAQQPFTILPP